MDDYAAVNKRPDGGAGYGGLRVCGSVWSCPNCAAKILARRADELLQAIEAWHEQGGAIAHVVLTMRHHHGDPLADLWDAMSPAWNRAHTNRAARSAKERAGWEGFVRNAEATLGANGWHLHTHALLFLRSADHVDDLGAVLFDGWRSALVSRGLSAPVRDSGGLDIKLMDLTEAREQVSSYLAKASFGESVKSAALELAGTASKQGGRSNRSTWQLLEDLTTGDDRPADRALWREWETASRGRRQMTWSRGLRDALVGDVEQSDEQIAEATDEATRVVALIGWRDWRRVIRCGNLAEQLLDAAEAHDDDGAAFEAIGRLMWAYGAGTPLRPPERPEETR